MYLKIVYNSVALLVVIGRPALSHLERLLCIYLRDVS